VDAFEREVPLRGGRSTPGVVRVGDTVRRPLKPDAARIHRLLVHLERSGFDGAPRFLGIDAQGRAILSYIDGIAPPHNGFRLSAAAVRAGARLLRRVHDLTAGSEFAAGAEVACHPALSQDNFIFRARGPDMLPVAIIDWDGTRPGTRVANFAEFLWAFVHPGMYGEGEAAARMLRVAADAYGWSDSGGGLVAAMLTEVRNFQVIVAGDQGAMDWAATELAYLERNAEVFRTRLSGVGVVGRRVTRIEPRRW
jgi:Phosphotransferase enzyme family